MAKPIKMLELHYPMIQFLIKTFRGQHDHDFIFKTASADNTEQLNN